jgi:hypothetical protein
MTRPFFSTTADVAVGAALVIAILWAVVTIGPVALERWF